MKNWKTYGLSFEEYITQHNRELKRLGLAELTEEEAVKAYQACAYNTSKLALSDNNRIMGIDSTESREWLEAALEGQKTEVMSYLVARGRTQEEAKAAFDELLKTDFKGFSEYPKGNPLKGVSAMLFEEDRNRHQEKMAEQQYDADAKVSANTKNYGGSVGEFMAAAETDPGDGFDLSDMEMS